jgi:hypothetical protein
VRELEWTRPGGKGTSTYTAQDAELGMTAEVGRVGRYWWYIKAWPTAQPRDISQVRLEAGLKTMADARAMALRTPCFRCGRGVPLIAMERYSPRWRCTDHETCEAERDLLTGGSCDPRDVQAYMQRTGAGRALAAAWATAYRKAAVKLYGIRNTHGLDTAAAFACDREATAAIAGITVLRPAAR